MKTRRPPCPPPTSRRRTRRGRSTSPGGRAWCSPYRELRPPRPTPRPSPTRLRRRAFATALAFVLATLAVGSRSAPASAASCPGHTAELGIRLVDVTRRLVTDPRARTYVIDHLAPGTTISRRVEVVNGTAAAVRLRLYPAAATIAGDRFVFLEGRTPDELTGWTAITPREVTLPACGDRKSTRLNSSHVRISYAVFYLKKKKNRGEHISNIITQETRAILRLSGRSATGSRLADHSTAPGSIRRDAGVLFFFLMIRRLPRYTLFPYTTLFR